MAGPCRSLIVEGWRFYPHSYAIVNQWQLLSLSRRSDVSVKILDAPLFDPHWRPQAGLFEPQAERMLQSMPAAAPGEAADLMLRMGFPYDFSLSASRRTAVFGTCEFQVIEKNQCRDRQTYEGLCRGIAPSPEVKIVTPSRWSAQGFIKAGFRPEQIHVIPHGVDADTFHPAPDLRARIRSGLSIPDGDFVFLNVGAMTGSKGIDLLFRAFTEVSRKYPHACLVLKGLDPLYNSKDRFLEIVRKMPPQERQRVLGRIRYLGGSLPTRKVAMLYQAADSYVSPYLAEGFNMPVLEAAACGLPVICTDGGATDDFVTDKFARKIESVGMSHILDDQKLMVRKPDVDHLIALMCAAIEDSGWRAQAAEQGPLHVRAHYTWDIVVDRLVHELLS